jgi:hypothetical protein
LSWQVAPSAQLIEQPATQETLQVDPALHERLPLAPSVIMQLDCSLQSTLHDSPHAPPQVDCAPHASVQLAPQVCVVTSQLPLAGQAQVAPVQLGGLVDTPPQPTTPRTSRRTETRIGFTMKERCPEPVGIRPKAARRSRATDPARGAAPPSRSARPRRERRAERSASFVVSATSAS